MLNNNPTWNRIQGNWHQLSGHVHQQWGKLTDNDVAQINGSREVLVGRLQERYGYAQSEANQQVDAWADRLKF